MLLILVRNIVMLEKGKQNLPKTFGSAEITMGMEMRSSFAGYLMTTIKALEEEETKRIEN